MPPKTLRRVALPAARLLLLVLASHQLAPASCELLMVYSIQRHGARNVLPKTATLKESDAAGGPTLLPEGQRQVWDAGEAFRHRYMNASLCSANASCLDPSAAEPGPQYGVVATPNGTWNNFNTLVRASALDRTIMTARSFLDAVFPPINLPTDKAYLPDGQQVVPVYSLPEDSNTLIRAYTACPVYDARLLEWFGSDEFQAKEAESAPLRDSVAALAPGLNTSLPNFWNVYDGFNVYRTYNVGTPMPPVDDKTFAQMQDLAYWLETSKMRSSLTGNLLAGPLLGDLLRYLEQAVTALTSNLLSPVYYKLIHVSGHYNTQLGVLGALQLDQLPAASSLAWFRNIPSLAALMAFELHGEPGATPQELAVRLVMQDGPSADYQPIPLPCAVPGDGAEALAGAGACTLEAFTRLVQPLGMRSAGEWCAACENESMSACKLRLLGQELEEARATSAGATSAGAGTPSSGSSLSSGAWAGILVGCVAAVAALFGAVLVLQHRRMQRMVEQAKLGSTQGAGLPGAV